METNKCEKCPYASFKRFGVYCEALGKPITNEEQLKDCKRGD